MTPPEGLPISANTTTSVEVFSTICQDPPIRLRCELRLHEESDGRVSVYCANLPGAISYGDGRDEAIERGREAIQALAETHFEDDGALPWVADPQPLRPGETQAWVVVDVERAK
jgi:predicted RNase H-like HicB family nuclease